jgi:hypothetical protein
MWRKKRKKSGICTAKMILTRMNTKKKKNKEFFSSVSFIGAFLVD